MLQEYYKNVSITSTDFFDNAISIARFDAGREWSALGKPTDRDEWGMTVPTVNVCIYLHQLERLAVLILNHVGIL